MLAVYDLDRTQPIRALLIAAVFLLPLLLVLLVARRNQRRRHRSPQGRIATLGDHSAIFASIQHRTQHDLVRHFHPFVIPSQVIAGRDCLSSM
jgi:hypothetical protein